MAPAMWKMEWRTALALSGALAMSSTASVVKLLSERLQMESERGKRVMGVLLFQDLAVVPLLVVIPALGSSPESLMRELANRAKQSCHLCTHFDGRIIVAAQVDSPGLWSFGLKLGAVMGLTETASGHVLLAFRDEAERTRMLAAQIKMHGDLDLDPAQLLRGLEEVRSLGYTVMPSRHTSSVTNIAHPVFGVTGQVIAALTVPYISRLEPAGSPNIEAVCVQVKEVAQQLSDLMGYRGYVEA
jgi:DNA-binding IclR family transcriptional regulator